MIKFLKEINIKQSFASPPIKAAYVERLNLTLKRSIYSYFYHNNTFRYIENLQDLVRAYNHRPHRSLGNDISPVQVNKTNESFLFNEMYINRPYAEPKPRVTKKFKYENFPRLLNITKYKYKPGQLVRVSYVRRTFERSFYQKFSQEIFEIAARYRKDNLPLYILKDMNGKIISGRWYEPELQAVIKSEKDLHKIEKIIKHRGKGRNHQVLVRWSGYGAEFDSWLPYSSVKNI
jgi:hypothetical protein